MKSNLNEGTQKSIEHWDVKYPKIKNQEYVNAARAFAIKAHGDQKYAEGKPFIVHLDHVAEVAQAFWKDELLGGDAFKHIIFASCYLHDVLEDTDVKKEDLYNEFGYHVAFLVDCVTDAEGVNRKERKKKTWGKIRLSTFAVFVKLCDRIANTESSAGSYTKMYQQEFPLFEAALYTPGQFDEMWEYLTKITKG